MVSEAPRPSRERVTMRRSHPAPSAQNRQRGLARAAATLAVMLALGTLAACESALPVMDHDRYGGLTRDDFRAALEPRPVPSSTAAAAEDGPPIPDLQPLVELPPLPSPAERRLVSVSVDETVPLRDVLIELARKAEVDLELDPRIEGGVILTMRDRPLREVIERIADLAGLRFAFRGSSLRIEVDEPYYVNYRVEYLHMTRQANSRVETSVNVMGGDQGTDGNASASAVSGLSDVNFWQELEASLSQILANSQPRQLTVIPAAAPPPISPPAVAPQPDQDPAGPEGAAPDLVDPGPLLDQAYVAPRPLPAEAAQGSGEPLALFTINRQAGIVSVFASERQHELIAAYLGELHESISRQVLIEAKILEVALTDEFSSGINWRGVLDSFSLAAPLGTSVAGPPFNTPFDATPGLVTLALDRGDLDVIANFIQRFGTVRTLSSPRVTVLQNQTAVLKVAENQVFFRLFFERIEEDDGDDQVNINSEIRTVPIGVIVTVQPSINRETEEISMALRPTVTRVVAVVNDPAVAIASNNTVVSQIPVVAVQEIDSVVTMRSGQVVVMGGLMRDIATNDDEGVPALGQLPGLGYLFKAREESTRQTELVVFLRATILDGGGIHPVDADLYRRFGGDRRPFPMPGVP
jgi:general secretion pathway protein D